ncbi:hypothetical protein [Paenibacillus sp. FSL P4-0184]|uniref:hypothetical protein n=1 Tax=Paenibacillus sp. FSL P4-0184 TaxID=2921632 RepID=UPI0030F8ACD9
MSYVAIPNRMFAHETEYFTTNDEYLVFYHIGTLVSARNPNLAHLNIELLNSIIMLDENNLPRGKNRIKVALLGLHSKNYINLDFKDDKLKYNTMLDIFFPNTEHPIYTEAVESGGSKYKGFTAVTDDMFYSTNSVIELKVLTYVEWRSKISYSIAYSEWECVLDVCHQTAVNIISDCNNKGLIKKHRGDYFTTSSGDIRQETNKYYRKSIEQEPIFEKKENTVLKLMKSSSESTETRLHKWFSDEFLDENDMYVYITTTCDLIKKQAKKRIDAISKNASGKPRMDKLLKRANEKLKKEESEMQVVKFYSKLSDEMMGMNGCESDDTYEETYRRTQQSSTKNNRDYSYLLGND